MAKAGDILTYLIVAIVALVIIYYLILAPIISAIKQNIVVIAIGAGVAIIVYVILDRYY